MSKLLQIAWHEYSRHVFRRRFIFSLFSLPLFIAAFAGILAFTLVYEEQAQAVGLVDPGSLLEGELCGDFVCYTSPTAAEAGLQARQVSSYYVIDPDYLHSGQVSLAQVEPVTAVLANRLSGALRQRLLDQQPDDIARRLEGNAHVFVQSADGSRSYQTSDLLGLLAPFGLIFIFFLAIFSTSGYLMQAITTEKENRTMEILLTSLSPNQVITGKVIGSLGAGLTQIVFWLALMAAAVAVGIKIFGFDQPLNLSGQVIGVGLASLLLAFVTISAMIAAVGAVVAESTEGQQITGPFSLPFILPFFFLAALISEPNGALAQVFTFIPFTAPVTLTLRLVLTPVPAWAVTVSLALQAALALLMLWLAGRLFHLGMLSYGKSLDLRQILRGSVKK